MNNYPTLKAHCYDCYRPYGDEYGFPDLVVPNAIWLKISPTGHEGGLLCPNCICQRCTKLGIKSKAVFTSGPFADYKFSGFEPSAFDTLPDDFETGDY